MRPCVGIRKNVGFSNGRVPVWPTSQTIALNWVFVGLHLQCIYLFSLEKKKKKTKIGEIFSRERDCLSLEKKKKKKKKKLYSLEKKKKKGKRLLPPLLPSPLLRLFVGFLSAVSKCLVLNNED